MPPGGASVRARNAITAFLRFAVQLFFRRVETVGLENIPEDGAVLFAVNHPNGLVDPLFVLCFAPRPVSFLAKAPLFRYPVIGWFARTLDSIPVYRKQDNTKGTNAETFGRAREILARGGSIAIFPEGTTHSDPQLRELKTGAARIALGANLDRLTIVPAGIYYTAKHIFRSNALVVFGEGFLVSGSRASAPGEEPPAGEVDGLTSRIDAALNSVTLQADSHAALELISRAEAIFSADQHQPLAEELEVRKRFIAGYHYLCAHDPERLQRLESTLVQFEAELGRAALEPHELREGVGGWTVLRSVLLFPLALIGAVLHYPTYRLVGFLAKQFARGANEMVATMKFLGALLLFPLTWLAFAFVAFRRFGLPATIATLLIIPILGWLALRVFEDLDRIIGKSRAFLFRRHAVERLRSRRRELRDEFVKVAEEMGMAD
jgi:1-acyl-sn-glycerol-3-phosphate acyltransferase